MPRPKAASGSLSVMRLTWLIVVGIATAGCRDKSASVGAQSADRATAGSATPKTATGATPQPRPGAPTLSADQLFDEETRDQTWAASAEQSIHAVAPELADVSCRRLSCRVTLTAGSEAELVAAADKLEADDSLRAIDGVQSIKLTAPQQRDGKLAMRLYVRFDRD